MRRARLWLIAAYVVAQLIFPLWQMAHGSERYDWAMFTFPRTLPQLQIRTASGPSASIDLDQWLGYGRGDVSVSERDLAELCRVAGEPAAIRLTLMSGELRNNWHSCR